MGNGANSLLSHDTQGKQVLRFRMDCKQHSQQKRLQPVVLFREHYSGAVSLKPGAFQNKRRARHIKNVKVDILTVISREQKRLVGGNMGKIVATQSGDLEWAF